MFTPNCYMHNTINILKFILLNFSCNTTYIIISLISYLFSYFLLYLVFSFISSFLHTTMVKIKDNCVNLRNTLLQQIKIYFLTIYNTIKLIFCSSNIYTYYRYYKKNMWYGALFHLEPCPGPTLFTDIYYISLFYLHIYVKLFVSCLTLYLTIFYPYYS
jgi:hypothetical protein